MISTFVFLLFLFRILIQKSIHIFCFEIPFFTCATTIIDVDGNEKNWPLPKAKHDFNFPNGCGFIHEAEAIRKYIRAGKKESDLVSHNDSLRIARIMDEIRKQIGVKYAEDD